MRLKNKIGCFVAAMAMALNIGCGTVKKNIVPPPISDDARLVEDYAVGVGDTLSVQVWKNPDLSIVVPVRPDGKISVPLVGDLMASGKYVEELAEDITTKLKSYVRAPKVTVIVQTPTSTMFMSKIRVTGEVARQSSLSFKKGMTVFDAIEAVGGVTPFAAKNEAALIRQVGGQSKSYPIYISEIFNEGNMRTNYQLLPLDVITVPKKAF